MSSTTSLVPPRRLGTLLRQARLTAGRDLDDLAANGPLSRGELDDIEHGRAELDEGMLDRLMRLYGVERAELVPERSQLVIDLDEGRIAVNQTDVSVEGPHGADAVLARYLALVYRLRGLRVGTGLEFRDVDLQVLSTALELEAGDIEARLRRLMDDEQAVEADQKRIRRQLVMPLVGVVIAATAIGTLLLVAENESPEPGRVATVVEGTPRVADAAVVTRGGVETDIGNGGAVEENPGAG